MKTKTPKCKIGKIVYRSRFNIYKVVNTLRDDTFYLDFRPSKHDFKVLCMKEFGWESDLFDELKEYVVIERVKILTYTTDF